MASALGDITIVDFSRILAGPLATMVLADLGATVIKVERPEGDDTRAWAPPYDDRGEATYFESVNRNKRSVVLDLKTDDGVTEARRLCDGADVVVENFRPGTMEKLGYGWETLHARYPQLIYAAASGFGHTGPNSKDPAYDMVMQGMGGIMSITGNEGQPPSRVGMSIGDIGAGLYTAVAVNAAIVHRLKTGESTKVDIGMFDCQLALLENAIMRYTVEGEIPGPLGARHPTITPFQAFKTSDGAIIIAAGNDGLFIKTCDALGRSDIAADPDYKTNALRQKNHGRLEREMESVLQGNTTAHWIAVVSKAGVPCGPINNVEQAIAHPQVAARNMLVEVPDGSGGTLKLAGNPLKMSAFADSPTRSAAPDLDSDRAAILAYLGG